MKHILLLLSLLIINTLPAQTTWKKISPEGFGITFELPTTWPYKADLADGIKAGFPIKNTGPNRPFFHCEVDVAEGTDYEDLEDEADDYIMYSADAYKLVGDFTQTTIAGKTALKATLIESDGGNTKLAMYFFTHADNVYYLVFGDNSATFNASESVYFSRIRSSIQTVSTQIKWKNIKSDAFKVSLKVPDSWAWSASSSSGILARASNDESGYNRPGFAYKTEGDLSDASALKTKAVQYCKDNYTRLGMEEANSPFGIKKDAKTGYKASYLDKNTNTLYEIFFFTHQGKMVVITLRDHVNTFAKNERAYFKDILLSIVFE